MNEYGIYIMDNNVVMKEHHIEEVFELTHYFHIIKNTNQTTIKENQLIKINRYFE